MQKLKLSHAVRVKTGKRNQVTFDIPEDYCGLYAELVRRSPDCLSLEIGLPRKARTTGEDSQNHKINGAIQEICIPLGLDFDALKYYLKYKAIDRGYPFDTIGDLVVPWSETRLDTVQASYLIETIMQFAAENNIRLRGE